MINYLRNCGRTPTVNPFFAKFRCKMEIDSADVEGIPARSTTFQSQENLERFSIDAMEDAGTYETPQARKISTWSGFLPNSSTRDTHVTPHHSSMRMNTTFSTTRTPGTVDKRNSARREAELIQARGRISQLELELSKTQHAAKRARRESALLPPGEGDGEKMTTISQELQRLHAVSQGEIS